MDTKANVALLDASRDEQTGQTYIPPRALAADGSLRPTVAIQVPARGVLHSATSFNGDWYGIVDLECGSRIQTLLAPGTDRIGAPVAAYRDAEDGPLRFRHD